MKRYALEFDVGVKINLFTGTAGALARTVGKVANFLIT